MNFEIDGRLKFVLIILKIELFRVFLNVCFSYASCYEITEAIRRLVDGSKEGKIYPR